MKIFDKKKKRCIIYLSLKLVLSLYKNKMTKTVKKTTKKPVVAKKTTAAKKTIGKSFYQKKAKTAKGNYGFAMVNESLVGGLHLFEWIVIGLISIVVFGIVVLSIKSFAGINGTAGIGDRPKTQTQTTQTMSK